ncbi:MAG TPA: MBL fold metallo-hydrolase [Edaphocola sp.]|nr:MBL fold metallo-hydrolase [Edaphocola sp.]
MITQIFPLSEGHFTVGRDKTFLPFRMETDELNDRSTGSLLVEVQPFLVVNEKDVILLDTGLGFDNKNGVSQLVANLRMHNIEPEDVTKVLMSHLHKDHSGGLPNILGSDAFFNAKIYVYAPELGFAYEKGAPSYMIDELDELRFNPQVEFLDGESGYIDDYIHFQHTNGHCPEHLVYWIDTNDGKIFYGGDEAPQYKQVIMKYIAKYDFDGRRAMELRGEWAVQGAKEQWKFLFYHDVKTPIAQLNK